MWLSNRQREKKLINILWKYLTLIKRFDYDISVLSNLGAVFLHRAPIPSLWEFGQAEESTNCQKCNGYSNIKSLA